MGMIIKRLPWKIGAGWRLGVAIVLIAGSIGFADAQTRVGGIMHGDIRWTEGSSPYLVESDLVVTRFAHLTIEPGVKVLIAAGKGTAAGEQFDGLDSTCISIRVQGALTCVGKKDKRVSFAPVNQGAGKLGWYGVIFDKASGKLCEIAYTDITGAYNGVTAWACNPLVRTSVLERNNIGINCLPGGSALVYNCIIADNFTVGIRVQAAAPRIANSIVVYNKNNGVWCDGPQRIKFEYNCVFGNGDGNFFECDPELGRLVHVNNRRDSVDYADNLFCDPVFAGSAADSIAFARDVRQPTDRSKIKNLAIALVVGETPRDSSYARYRARKWPRFALSRYSPCINTGDPARRFKNVDGKRCSIGIYGGPEVFARENE
jgi:hypothetical protein